MTTLSVVIPAYNEEQGIADISRRVLAVRDDLRRVGVEEMELLVVDDGSSDRTAAIAQDIQGVRLIQHPTNRGYGAALKTGFSQAKGELIGFLDADGTYPPEYFPHLCRVALDDGELIVGSRMAGANSRMPLSRRVGNLFFAQLLSLVGRQAVSDSASGMRVFRREILARIYPLPDGLNLTPVMSTRAIHEGLKMSEVPIPYAERLGRSKLSVVKDGSVFLHSIVWTALTYNPVRILGLLGLGGLGLAGFILLGLALLRLGGVAELGPWGVVAVFVALVSAVTGISVFSLGVTFNYLVALFYKRPVRQGLFGRPIFKTPLDRQFGWMGALSLAAGLLLGLASLLLGLSGWEITRLWLYLLGGALLTLVGVQLMIYWILLRVLDELSQREMLASRDLARPEESAYTGTSEVAKAAAVAHS
ncbi:MAG: glycosyltransferase family 2 protein [Candidatus Promineifilaceae bacterium]